MYFIGLNGGIVHRHTTVHSAITRKKIVLLLDSLVILYTYNIVVRDKRKYTLQ